MDTRFTFFGDAEWVPVETARCLAKKVLALVMTCFGIALDGAATADAADTQPARLQAFASAILDLFIVIQIHLRTSFRASCARL